MLDFGALLGNGSASATYYARLLANQTAATVGPYTSQFTGLNAEVTYAEYLLVPPDCSTLTATSIPITTPRTGPQEPTDERPRTR